METCGDERTRRQDQSEKPGGRTAASERSAGCCARDIPTAVKHDSSLLATEAAKLHRARRSSPPPGV